MADFVTKDSGERREFVTGAVRDVRGGKGRFDLIPGGPLKRLAMAYERGAVKYNDWNWARGMPLSSFLDSAFRHLNELRLGEPTEDHAAAVLFNVMGYIHTLDEVDAGRLPQELDDRRPPAPEYASQVLAPEDR